MPKFEIVGRTSSAEILQPKLPLDPAPTPSFGLDDDGDVILHTVQHRELTPEEQIAIDAEREWSKAHEEMCGYTRYGQVPDEVRARVKMLWDEAVRLAYPTQPGAE